MSLLSPLDRMFEELDLFLRFPRRITLYFLVVVPKASHQIRLNTGPDIREKLRRRSAKKNTATDYKLQSRRSLLFLDS